MEAVAQSELFGGLFVESPTSEGRALRERYRVLMEEHGPLLPQSAISMWLDVSRARVSELALEGTLPRFKIGQHWYIPMVAVELYRTSERKAGRPIREKTFGENVGKVWQAFKDRRK